MTVTRAKVVKAQIELVDTLVHVGRNTAGTCCWGCGYEAGVDLELAHVVARVYGGGDTPDNYFLLCHRCHGDQPDGVDRESQIRWLRNRVQWQVHYLKYSFTTLDRLRSVVPPGIETDGLIALWTWERGADGLRRLMEAGAKAAASQRAETRIANSLEMLVIDFAGWLAAR